MRIFTLWKILQYEWKFIDSRSKKESYAGCLRAWLMGMLLCGLFFYGVQYIEDIFRWMGNVLPIGEVKDRPLKQKEWHQLMSVIICGTGFVLFTTQYVKALYQRLKNRSYETI